MTTVNSIEAAKESYKNALLSQQEPINLKIQEVKAELAALENSKKAIQTQINLIDKKPGVGRVWSAEAKAKLSLALKASAAKKKAALAAVVAPTTAPVVDNKMKAANDDSAAPAPAKKAARK
jgi:hypothetical protein